MSRPTRVTPGADSRTARMRLTIVGSGDAFGSGGRFNTCFLVETREAAMLVDCGASSMVALKARGIDPNRIDAIVLSHLHGDHFGGLPFFLIDAQHGSHRLRPLLIAGPPGTRARIDTALETLFPGSAATRWRFALSIAEIEPGRPEDVLGHRVATTEVRHKSGAPSTAVRLSHQGVTFAYSGDTEWTDALASVAQGAQLFIVECSGYDGTLPGHLTWETLRPHLPELRAERVMVTHMDPTALAHLDEIRAAGVLTAEDGLAIELAAVEKELHRAAHL
jgi:ribonuclease BN (tRNA processing enzyme)